MKYKKSISILGIIIMACSILTTGNIFDVRASEKTFVSEKDYESYIAENSSTFFESIPMVATQKLSGSTEDLTLYTYEMEPATILDSNNEMTAKTVLYEMKASGSTTQYENDDYEVLQGHITIYYQDAGNGLSLLTRVTGGYTHLPGGPFTVTGQQVSYGMTGIGYGKIVEVADTKYPTGSSFSYNTNFTSAVQIESALAFGASYKINLKHPVGGNTWEFFMVNDLVLDI